MLSEEEKELNAKMDSLADEYMKREIPKATWANAENLSLVLTYKKTANLVKHSENLIKWTKVIAGTSVALIVFAIAQIIVLVFKA